MLSSSSGEWGAVMNSEAAGDVEAGFAKLQGDDFEYYMQTYSIILGRNSKKSAVDVDLAGLGGGMNISRQHARIYYDFERKRFALEVLGKNGCFVESVLYPPGSAPVKLDSQDLLQIGDKKFYFLLPVKSIVKNPPPPAHLPISVPVLPALQIPISVPLSVSASPGVFTSANPSKKRSSSKSAPLISQPAAPFKTEDFYQQSTVKKSKSQKRQDSVEMTLGDRKWAPHDGSPFMLQTNYPKQNMVYHTEPRMEPRRRTDANSESVPMQAEEKDVVSAVANVLSDLCSPGQWMAMPKLHSELVELYGGIWPSSRVRKYLTSEDADGDRPWAGLLALLRKYPEHFVINTKTKGRMTSEFVSLVSLLA